MHRDRGNIGTEIYVKNWFEDLHLAIALTLLNPTTPAYRAESSRRRLAAAYKGERDKTTYYGRTLAPSHFRVFKFHALAFDTFGGYTKTVSTILTRLSKILRERSRLDVSDSPGLSVRQAISLCIHKAVAESLHQQVMETQFLEA